MPRAARIIVDEGYYHVLTRGNDKKKVFRKEKDYSIFKSIVVKYLATYKIFITNYCLMPNHIHLLINSEKGEDLPKFMQAVLQVYADYFKKKYNSVGFLFQNRYKSRLIKNENYLLDCACYIERNPVRAGLVEKPEDYPWSSFKVYAEGHSDCIVNKLNPMFLCMAQSEQECRDEYKKYLQRHMAFEDIVDEVFRIK